MCVLNTCACRLRAVLQWNTTILILRFKFAVSRACVLSWLTSDLQARKYAFKCHRANVRGVDSVYPVNALAFHPVYDIKRAFCRRLDDRLYTCTDMERLLRAVATGL